MNKKVVLVDFESFQHLFPHDIRYGAGHPGRPRDRAGHRPGEQRRGVHRRLQGCRRHSDRLCRHQPQRDFSSGPLQGLVRYGVGYDVIDVDAATDYNIAVCNIPHYCSEEVAVHACALILDSVRRITVDDRHVKAGDWNVQAGYGYSRLSTMTLGILGFGNIARKVAAYMKAFGCRLMAYDPYVPDEVFAQAGVERASKDEICPRGGYHHRPHPPQQGDAPYAGPGRLPVDEGRRHHRQHLPGRSDRPGGPVRRPGRRKVRAAGLDVLENEPVTDPKARILQYENVTITPHRGAQSQEATDDLIVQVIETAITAVEGTLPENTVNRKALLAKRQ